MRDFSFALFTLSGLEVFRLDIVLKVGNRENYSDANTKSVQMRETQTTKQLPLAPEFTCQGHLITALNTLNLCDVSTVRDGVNKTFSRPRHRVL